MHVDNVRPAAVLHRTGTAYHHVGVDIDRIDGVGDTDGVVPANEFLDIARVALCAVVDEYLVNIEMDATRQEVVLQYSLTQEIVTLLRSIAVEAAGRSHLVGSLMHSFNYRRAQWLGDVAYAQRDDVGLGVRHLEGVDLLGNVCKQIVVWQL